MTSTRALAGALALVSLLALPGCGAAGDDPPTGPDRFDRQQARERARSFLGVAEEDIDESGSVRIVRRGDEHIPGTMDLRPGRLNLELDRDPDGTFVVTRVVVEVPDGHEPLVVE